MTKPRQPMYGRIFGGDEEKAELAKVIWHEVVADLVKADAVTAANVARADRYVRARIEYEEVQPIAMAEGAVKVSEATGGEYFNYNWSAAEKLGDRLLKLEKAMFGEAQAAKVEQKPKRERTSADEFLGGPNHGIRQ